MKQQYEVFFLFMTFNAFRAYFELQGDLECSGPARAGESHLWDEEDDDYDWDQL